LDCVEERESGNAMPGLELHRYKKGQNFSVEEFLIADEESLPISFSPLMSLVKPFSA